MSLPTQQELAEIIHAEIVAVEPGRSERQHDLVACAVRETYYRIADAILTRLEKGR